MTPRDADEAAQRRLPIEHGDITYVRIAEVGYQYDDKGQRSPFVQLLDKCGHSVTYADPGRCKIKEEEQK